MIYGVIRSMWLAGWTAQGWTIKYRYVMDISHVGIFEVYQGCCHCRGVGNKFCGYIIVESVTMVSRLFPASDV